jgi:3-(3-hydroxy-phenyl)propionate hydroxylase
MHDPATEPRSSVFYDYKVYPARRPVREPSVAIVGAGPIGLVTALDLARFGVPSVILEQERQVSHGSRAIVLTRRSMEILQQLGLHEPFLDKGLQWSQGRSFFRGKEVYRMVMPHDPDDRFLPALNLQQQYIEEYLVRFCEANPLIELCWGQKVEGLAQTSTGATLRIDSTDGEYELDVPWVVAADGGRSTIRRLLGLRMEGRSYAGNFVIADIKARIDLPTQRLCYFDPPWNPGNNVLVHRQPDDIWRIDFRLPEGESPEQALEPAKLRERIDLVLKMIEQDTTWELDWATVYTANTLTLPEYVHGRVLFTGDAAHLLPIFGVRGANTGLQDCNNLAWKLAFVARGGSGLPLLQTYSLERVQAAREICEEGGRSTRFMTPPTPGSRLLRDAVLSFSLSEDFARNLMHWRTSRPHDYYNSPLNSSPDADREFVGGPACGQPIRNVRLGENRYLLDLIAGRPGFLLILFADEREADGSSSRVLGEISTSSLPVIRMVVSRAAVDAGTFDADVFVEDRDNRVREKYAAGAGAAYLFRPDMHVCARWLRPQTGQVSEALRVAACRPL